MTQSDNHQTDASSPTITQAFSVKAHREERPILHQFDVAMLKFAINEHAETIKSLQGS